MPGTKTDSSPAEINLGDTVLVENLSNNQFSIEYDSRSYALPPNKPTYVPFEAVALWFGDPRSTSTMTQITGDNPQMIPSRDDEVRRLSVKWGHQTGNVHDYLSGNDENSPVPKIKVLTIDGSKPITTVLDDPAGESTTPAFISNASVATQDQLIKKQQDQIDTLTQILKSQGMMQDYEGQESDIPEDNADVGAGTGTGVVTSTPEPIDLDPNDPFAHLGK